ncbi:MAG: energy-coupling factor ABC transporter permease [Sedimentibacter sp.]
MHMADALISAAAGGTMWAATAGITGYSVKKVQRDFEEKLEFNEEKIPLMGVMGAFVFASQMINFTIPGTGSSGHIGGGMLLAALLGPHAGFLTMVCIISIQALFFADGGLLALGCNIFNMGFYSCFIAYPLIYKKIVKKGMSKKTIFIGSLLSVVIGLQLGAFSVVLETIFSGKTELPFGTFVLLMQPIHLAIGAVEGLITASVLTFVWNARPEILEPIESSNSAKNASYKKVITALFCTTVIIGGIVSWFASSNPDGLEWSIEKATGSTEVDGMSAVHELFENIQEKTAFLPDYNFKSDSTDQSESSNTISAGTSVSGVVGSIFTLALAGSIGTVTNTYRKRKKSVGQN